MRLHTLLHPAVFVAFAGIASAQDTAIVAGPLGARADSVLRKAAAAGLSAVALAAKDGQIILRQGYGLANRATKTPMSASTIVQIGSNTKDFTAVAILQLLERGKLTLADSIGKFFRDVPTDKRAITIEYLLHHRAGFAQHMGPDFDQVMRDQEIAKALAATLLFEPGTKSEYSNIGFSLLAAIVEQLSGKSYDEYVRDHILIPLGLRNTGLLLPRFDKARVAIGYRDGKSTGTMLDHQFAPDGAYWNLRGNGGMLSTVDDMFRFYRALFSDGPLLKPATRDLFFHSNEAIMLAGSDMTFYFLYRREPRAGIATILAINSTDYPPRKANSEPAEALGLGAGGGRGERVVTTTPGTPVRLPDTPAGRGARKFLDAGADDATLRRFLEQDVIKRPDDTRTIDQRIAAFRETRDQMGALTLAGIGETSATTIVFNVRAAKTGIVTFTISVEAQPPFRITTIQAEAR